MEYINYNWNQLDNHINELSNQIGNIQFDHILAISRGGNVVGTAMSYKLDVPLTVYDPKRQKLSDFKYIDWLNDSILFVDDINDSGTTIEQFKICVIKTREFFHGEGQKSNYNLDNIRFLTLFNNLTSKSTVDYAVIKIDRNIMPDVWVKFAWETY